jgi:flotillin
VISTDGAGRIPRAVADNVAQGLELLGSTTGVDLAELLKGITRKDAPAPAAEQPPVAPPNGKVEITG